MLIISDPLELYRALARLYCSLSVIAQPTSGLLERANL